MNSFRAQKNQSNSLILYILPIRLSRKKKWFDRTSLAIRTNNIFYDHNWAGPSLIWNFNLSFFSLKKQSDSLMLRLMFDQTNFLWKIIFWERFTKSTVSIIFFSIKVPYIWTVTDHIKWASINSDPILNLHPNFTKWVDVVVESVFGLFLMI